MSTTKTEVLLCYLFGNNEMLVLSIYYKFIICPFFATDETFCADDCDQCIVRDECNSNRCAGDNLYNPDTSACDGSCADDCTDDGCTEHNSCAEEMCNVGFGFDPSGNSGTGSCVGKFTRYILISEIFISGTLSC